MSRLELPEQFQSAKFSFVASDMDGTFLNGDCVVSDSTWEAYMKLKNAGIKVFPATGRSIAGLRNSVGDKPFQYFPGVYINGALVFGENENDVLASKCLPHESCFLLAEFIEGLRRSKEFENAAVTLGVLHKEGFHVDFDTAVARELRDHMKDEEAFELKAPLPEMLKEFPNTELYQFNIYAEPPVLTKVRERFQTFVEEEPKALFHLSQPLPGLLNIVPQHLSKRVGIEKLFEHFPFFKKEELVAIGDGGNDIEMLDFATCAIAMGNASKECKAHADFFTTSNKEDGWATAMESLFHFS